ncbi:MAG: hypothetical protein KME32_33940 [Mojavia pulchra JT2-VF2]|jgi:hypothetical protein|uniref:Uncharacterized protein n=1 Tax=Mojavia pulchra JT2-VF2 TaxID=287848 RepID=A0A951Q557_9NOST|nr:hypothetical protein [Mojavia pulchra JT2-VF2]
MARLNNASKAAAETVAEKIAKGGKATTPQTSNVVQMPSLATDVKGNVAVNVPGLHTLTPDLIPASLPQFQQTDYRISDPLNPPENLPQATEAQFNSGMAIYEGAQRALKLTGAAFDTTREKFTVIGKQAKAIGAGIIAATEIEKVKGNFLDYQTQLEVTQQKGITFDVAQTKTVTDRNIAIHTKTDLAEKLKLAEIKSQESAAKTLLAQGKLNAFKQQLGKYLSNSK